LYFIRDYQKSKERAMPSYIRFETQRQCAHFKRRLGVFRTAGQVEATDLPEATAEWLRETLKWFHHNLIIPSGDSVDRRGIFWFRGEARDVIERMWDLVVILHDEGVHVDIRHTKYPGRIVYRDDQQVAAIPDRR
jgi:hypothetical protein